jgi:hypothetical protein
MPHGGPGTAAFRRARAYPRVYPARDCGRCQPFLDRLQRQVDSARAVGRASVKYGALVAEHIVACTTLANRTGGDFLQHTAHMTPNPT